MTLSELKGRRIVAAYLTDDQEQVLMLVLDNDAALVVHGPGCLEYLDTTTGEGEMLWS